MKQTWRELLLALAVLCISGTLLGCTSTSSSASAAAGRDGWVREKDEPGIALYVKRGGETVVVQKGDTSTEYCIVAKPALFHSASNIVVPLFPGSAFLRSTNYVYKEHRFYSIPDGKTFDDVYHWYMTWFEFSDRQ